jgi:hypothetical protein
VAPTPATTKAQTSRTFEIHRKSGGRWIVDSIADDKQIAIRMANALLKTGRAHGGVKVMAVTQGPDGEFRESQIYQATPESQASVASSQAPPPSAPKAKIRIERAKPDPVSTAAARRGTAKKKARGSIAWPVWVCIAAVGLVVAYGAIFGLPGGGQPWIFDSKEAQTTVKTPNSFQQQYRTIFDR